MLVDQACWLVFSVKSVEKPYFSVEPNRKFHIVKIDYNFKVFEVVDSEYLGFLFIQNKDFTKFLEKTVIPRISDIKQTENIENLNKHKNNSKYYSYALKLKI